MADEGRRLVDSSYIQKYLVGFGNDKMEANWSRTDRLHHLFQDMMLKEQVLQNTDTNFALNRLVLACITG